MALFLCLDLWISPQHSWVIHFIDLTFASSRLQPFPFIVVEDVDPTLNSPTLPEQVTGEALPSFPFTTHQEDLQRTLEKDVTDVV